MKKPIKLPHPMPKFGKLYNIEAPRYNEGLRKMEAYYKPLLTEALDALRNTKDFVEDATDSYPTEFFPGWRLNCLEPAPKPPLGIPYEKDTIFNHVICTQPRHMPAWLLFGGMVAGPDPESALVLTKDWDRWCRPFLPSSTYGIPSFLRWIYHRYAPLPWVWSRQSSALVLASDWRRWTRKWQFWVVVPKETVFSKIIRRMKEEEAMNYIDWQEFWSYIQ